MLKLIRYVAGWLTGEMAGDIPVVLLGLDPCPPVDVAIKTQQDDEIMHRLVAMPVMVREIYLLRMVDHMPIDDIARRLALSRRETEKSLATAIRLLHADGPS